MKTVTMWFLSLCFSFMAVGILMGFLPQNMELQYILSLVMLACGFILTVGQKKSTDQIMQILLVATVALSALNVLNILFVHNWGTMASFLNVGLSFICLAYKYISTYVLAPKQLV